MCRKSPIRTTWKWKEGDFYAGTVHKCRDPEFNKVEWPVEYGGVCSEDHDPNYKAGCGENWYSETWPLPRQDQLQEMLKSKVLTAHGNLWNTFCMFSDFLKAEILRYHSNGVVCDNSFVLTAHGNLWNTFCMFSDFLKAEILRYHSNGVVCDNSFEMLWLKCVHLRVYKLEWRQGEWIGIKEGFNDGMKFKYL